MSCVKQMTLVTPAGAIEEAVVSVEVMEVDEEASQAVIILTIIPLVKVEPLGHHIRHQLSSLVFRTCLAVILTYLVETEIMYQEVVAIRVPEVIITQETFIVRVLLVATDLHVD